MRGSRLILTLLIFGLVSVAFSTPAYAGFADDWVAQKVVTRPNSYKGQTRSYASLGGFSYRYQAPTTDKLFTVTPPRVRAGCGGIDMQFGAFSYLNMEYLVDKLNKILRMAPAAAFDIALNTLCQQCSATISKLEATLNAFNSLQLDDCKAAKALIAAPLSAAGADDKEGHLGTIVQDFGQSTGYSDFATQIKNNWGSSGTPDAGLASALDDCPEDIKKLLKGAGNEPSTLLKNVGVMNGVPPAYTDLIRSLVGDIHIFPDPGGLISIGLIAPCPENENVGLNEFIQGEVYVKTANGNGACVLATDTAANLVNYATTKLTAISIKMAQGNGSAGVLNTDEINFINATSANAYMMLKNGIITGQVDEAIAVVAEVTAYAMARHLLDDLARIGSSLVSAAHQTLTIKNTPNTPRCKVSLGQEVLTWIPEMSQYLKLMKESVAEQSIEAEQKLATQLSFIAQFDNMAARLNKEISSRVGNSVNKKASN